MAGTPVVTVAAGGLAVTETTLGLPVTEATPKFGIAVTKVAAGGLPVNFGSTDSAEATAYAARTSGLNATHLNAYKALINGLVADGVFAKLDALYVFANQDRTNAVLNLVQNNYNCAELPTPDFIVDKGFRGATGYLQTSFIPSSASSPKMGANSASMFFWNLTTSAISGQSHPMGSAADYSIGFRFDPGTAYGMANGNAWALTAAISADISGFWAVTRSGAAATELYKVSTLIDTDTMASTGLATSQIAVCAYSANVDAHCRVAAAGFGSLLSAANLAALNARLTTCLTAVGAI